VLNVQVHEDDKRPWSMFCVVATVKEFLGAHFDLWSEDGRSKNDDVSFVCSALMLDVRVTRKFNLNLELVEHPNFRGFGESFGKFSCI
jgi:hypothetical protein